MQDLHWKEETTLFFGVHGMSVPWREVSFFNYAKVNTVSHSMAPLNGFISMTKDKVCLLSVSNVCQTTMFYVLMEISSCSYSNKKKALSLGSDSVAM